MFAGRPGLIQGLRWAANLVNNQRREDARISNALHSPHPDPMPYPAILVTIVALAALVATLIWSWRKSVAAQTRERELQKELSQSQIRAALGEQASKSLAAAVNERAEAQTKAAVADIRAAEASAAAKSTAEAAKATAEAVAAAARDRAADLTARLAAANAELVKKDSGLSALNLRLTDSETARGAGQAEITSAKATLAKQDISLAEAKELTGRLQSESTAAKLVAQRLQGEISQNEALSAERNRQFDEAQARLPAQLQAMAQQLYTEQGKAMLGEGREQLEQTLTPFKERLQELQTRINEVHANDIKDRASLHGGLKDLLVAQNQLSTEANQLSKALRADTKAQGAWGELTLHRLLEASQLEKNLAYELQVAVHSDEDVGGRPDAVLFLPDRKALVIDAKVSLTAFMRATNALTEEERIIALKEHVLSVRNHITSLARRNYPESVKETLKGHSLDLTLLFLPSEAAFAAAVVHDGELWSDAFSKRILIVSPTTLLATLRVVAQIWRVEKQDRNTDQIVELASGISKKLGAALEDLERVERALGNAQKEFTTAKSKLFSGKGNVVRKVESMIRLGVRADDSTRALLAKESDGADEDGPVAVLAVGSP